MRNSSGKSGVLIIVLSVIILVAVVPWFFLLLNYFFQEDAAEPIPAPVAETIPPDTETATEDTSDTEPEPEPTPEATPSPNEESITDIADAYPDLFRELNAVSSLYNTVAAGLVVFDGTAGEYFTYKYGFADKEANLRVDNDTKFRIASLTKIVTVICAMTLADDGLLDLDTDISTYFGYEVKNTHFPGTYITARMLMQHTSSIFDSGAFQTSRERDTSEPVRFLLDRGASFRRNEPGTVFEYSNFGYAVLGALCERVAGKSLDALAREKIFEPLEIDAAYVPERLSDTENIAVLYDNRHMVILSAQTQLAVGESDTPGHDLHLAQGNLTITLMDFSRILTMLGNRGVFDGVRVLSQTSVNEMFRVVDFEDGSFGQGLGVRYTSDDFIEDMSFYWHTGSAYGLLSQFIFCRDTNRGIVAATTGATADRLENNKIDVCTELSLLAWSIFDSASE